MIRIPGLPEGFPWPRQGDPNFTAEEVWGIVPITGQDDQPPEDPRWVLADADPGTAERLQHLAHTTLGVEGDVIVVSLPEWTRMIEAASAMSPWHAPDKGPKWCPPRDFLLVAEIPPASEPSACRLVASDATTALTWWLVDHPDARPLVLLPLEPLRELARAANDRATNQDVSGMAFDLRAPSRRLDGWSWGLATDPWVASVEGDLWRATGRTTLPEIA